MVHAISPAYNPLDAGNKRLCHYFDIYSLNIPSIGQ